jgi:hypothetical protein
MIRIGYVKLELEGERKVRLDIRNSLGSYMEINIKRGTTLSFFTYDYICVEMDLSKGILDKLLLK